MSSKIVALEAEFMVRRQVAPDLPGAFASAFAMLSGELPEPERLRLAGIGRSVAAAVDTWAAQQPELPYHDRHHAAEATIAMGHLCRSARCLGLLSPLQGALGVVAMVGHDIGHDGSVTGGGVLEAAAAAEVLRIAAAGGLQGGALDALGDVILATDPALIADNAVRLHGGLQPGPMGAGHDALRLLANEADVCGSLMPRLGPRLSRLLMEEWRPANNPALLKVGTAAGRCAFLREYPALSPAGLEIGLETARQSCLDAYAHAGALLGCAATPAAGCAALDKLPDLDAAQVYATAVADLAR